MLTLYRHTPNTNEEATADLADKLLVSTVSGSKKAEYLLINFKKKFTALDGTYGEAYDTTMGMLGLWEKMKRIE